MPASRCSFIRTEPRLGSRSWCGIQRSAVSAPRSLVKCYSHSQMHGLPLLQFVAVAMLILANAFFVAAEFALVSIRDTRIEQMLAARVPGARAVRRLQHDLDDFLPAVQLGVTLCSLALGWIGEPLAAGILLGWLDAAAAHPAARAALRARCGRRAGLCAHYLFPRGGGRAGAEVPGAAPGRGAGGGRGSADAVVYGDGAAGGAVSEELGRGDSARLRHSDDRARRGALAGGTEADCHGRAAHGACCRSFRRR